MLCGNKAVEAILDGMLKGYKHQKRREGNPYRGMKEAIVTQGNQRFQQ